MVVTLILPKEYVATASVVVQGKADPLSNTAAYPALLPSDIATQVDIIESHRVAQRAVKLLKLDESQEIKDKWQRQGKGDLVGWIADLLQKKVTVVPSKESDVIGISAKWGDAKFAADLANAWAAAYIDTNIELKVDSAKQYASWFNDQSRTLRADLEAKEKRLADFQNAAGIVATDDKLDVENARLQELSTELVAVQTQRQQSQSRQRQARGDAETLPEVLQSPVIANLKASLAAAEAKRRDMATNYGKNYPDDKDVEAEIAGLHERIAQESERIARLDRRHRPDRRAPGRGSEGGLGGPKAADTRFEASARSGRGLSERREHGAKEPRRGLPAIGSKQPRKPGAADEHRVARSRGRAHRGFEPETHTQRAFRTVRGSGLRRRRGAAARIDRPPRARWGRAPAAAGRSDPRPYSQREDGIGPRSRDLRPAGGGSHMKVTLKNKAMVNPGASPEGSRSIGAILVGEGRLSPSDVDKIERFAREQGLRFGDAAVQLQLLAKEDVEFAIARQFNYPILACGQNGVGEEVIAGYKPESPMVEPLRALRSQILFRWPRDTTRKVIAVTSAERGDGRSWLAANLATVFAQIGERTLLIDADMRHPRQHLLFNLNNEVGLSALVTGRATREIARRIHPQLRLFVLPSGRLPPNPQELLSGPVFDVVLEQFTEQFDVIVIDTPAMAETADAQILAARAGNALMVARRNHTRQKKIVTAMRNLAEAGVNVLGSVIQEL